MPVTDHIDNTPRFVEFNPGVATTDFVLPFPVYEADDATELKSDFLVVKDDVVSTAFSVVATFNDGVSIDAKITFDPGITGNLKIYSRRRPRTGAQFPAGAGITPTELQAALHGVLASLRDVYDWMTSLEADNVLPAGTFLPTAGGTMTGPITLNADPASALQASTKQYVDNNFEPLGAYKDFNDQVGTTYTLVLADKGKLLSGSNAAAIIWTVPPNASVAFPVKSRIDLWQKGAGQISIAAGAGVTIRSASGALKIVGQYSGASLTKIGTDEWLLVGNITT